MSERDWCIKWVKAHKKQMILAGISITAIIGTFIGIKNREAIIELWSCLNCPKKASKTSHESLTVTQTMPSVIEDAIMERSYTSPQKAFGVSQHIRTLSGGRHHSIEKTTEAVAIGIELLPNQTLVDSYTKYAA